MPLPRSSPEGTPNQGYFMGAIFPVQRSPPAKGQSVDTPPQYLPIGLPSKKHSGQGVLFPPCPRRQLHLLHFGKQLVYRLWSERSHPAVMACSYWWTLSQEWSNASEPHHCASEFHKLMMIFLKKNYSKRIGFLPATTVRPGERKAYLRFIKGVYTHFDFPFVS